MFAFIPYCQDRASRKNLNLNFFMTFEVNLKVQESMRNIWKYFSVE